MPQGTSYRELTVGARMSRSPVTARAGNTLADVEAMMEQSSIRHLPVVDGDGCVIGVLSNRDLLRATGRARNSVVVSDLMTQDVLWVREDTPLREASAVMLERKIGALPVVDANECLVGIITETDFLRIAHEVCGGSEPGA